VGWTGIQYSAFRVALAVAVAQVCLARLPSVEGPGWPLLALGLPGAFAFALGWRDRAVAINLLALVAGLAALVDGAPLVLPGQDVILTGSLLFLHLLSPITPFGSWDARDRVDPRGDWARPSWQGHLAWAWLALVHLAHAFAHWGDAARTTTALEFAFLSGITALFEIAFAITIFRTRWRAPAWVALTLWQIAWFAAFGFGPGAFALLVLHALAADPGWWPGRRLHPLAEGATGSGEGELDEQTAHLFYDGECGFCHRSVRIVLSEELGTPEPLRLRFAPLQGDLFAHLVRTRNDIDGHTLPDSIVLVLEDGTLLTRSAAALEIASRLGGLWRGLALLFRLVPESLLDSVYDAIARVRKRIFAEPKDACPILPPDLRARFDF
jgi:predicted DCC family thiol-disulfide oxidoreductase YuxK